MTTITSNDASLSVSYLPLPTTAIDYDPSTTAFIPPAASNNSQTFRNYIVASTATPTANNGLPTSTPSGVTPQTSTGASSVAASTTTGSATSMTTPSTSSSATVSGTTGTATNSEFRVRIGYLDSYVPTSASVTSAIASIGSSSASATGSSSVYAAQYTGILAPLAATQGLRFPYTPSITNNSDADYGTMSMTHANTDYHAYNHTPNVQIGISGKFTIQNYQDGLYALSVIHFLRTVSKMYFGEADAAAGTAGTPPPILQLNGYGTYMYNKVRVYVKSSSFNFDENVDMVNIKVNSNYYVRLPVLFTISTNLVVQNTARAQRKDFSLDAFKSGSLMETTPSNSGWI